MDLAHRVAMIRFGLISAAPAQQNKYLQGIKKFFKFLLYSKVVRWSLLSLITKNGCRRHLKINKQTKLIMQLYAEENLE